MIAGHRGAAALAPENTLAGIKKAADLGIKWIETDTQLSADGVPMIFHDAAVDRCTDGSGKVEDLTLSELKALDAGSWFSADFSGEPIPTLEEVLRLCADRDMNINLELKIHSDEQVDALVEKVSQVIESVGFPAEKLILSSFSINAVKACRKVMSGIRAGYITEEESLDYLDRLEGIDLYSVHVNQKILTEEMAQRIRERGYELNIWTMNEPEKQEHFKALGVEHIITDDPSLF